MQDTAVQSLHTAFTGGAIYWEYANRTSYHIYSHEKASSAYGNQAWCVHPLRYGISSLGIISSRNSTPSYADAVVGTTTVLCWLKNSPQKQLNAEKRNGLPRTAIPLCEPLTYLLKAHRQQ